MAGRGFKDSGDELLSEINIIPLVDISLVLLLIFMVTANYIMTSSFSVDIAHATHGKAVQQTDVVTIGISREGQVYLENELVTAEELKKELQAKNKNNSETSVILSVDKDANFKDVVHMLDNLSELGITKLNIAATPETK
jgi:biopolymer transport protein ExbD